ncbi:heme exporter protein CcmD [Halopseudomonas salegens]|uniref:Heme exporter protein D n=1 Tax=Halopseudomonas salegens TaxID=1434072 RepID=A0A1H2FY30_9GAMM|nr:heme exporter protein CcmD [Halopseudomonas salegens]SDU12160.1 heme exporter protein D [Halopseudomonas salegens]
MSGLSEFFAMDGHGPYVWASYVITLAILALNVVQPWLARKRLIKETARRRRREEM